MPDRTSTVAAALGPAVPATAGDAVYSIANIDLMPSNQALGTQISVLHGPAGWAH